MKENRPQLLLGLGQNFIYGVLGEILKRLFIKHADPLLQPVFVFLRSRPVEKNGVSNLEPAFFHKRSILPIPGK